ncbi:hypothetical protein HMPREF0620_1101 [Parascardovia denticolens DSM 10105 = JCM 12538]|uniref:Uncharacterized protein n=1 Tax=Parascardovia denticolens DSM 10105 = JCM 12538 TaxID=864564 RepID=E6JZU2_PARDN|nr:hypothetical protein HMPREF0620_1101 [Parascardovia denticolens DSM 10105 = JCM 12538]
MRCFLRQGSKLGYGVETVTRPPLRLDETVLPVTLILRGRLKAVSGRETTKADSRPGGWWAIFCACT